MRKTDFSAVEAVFRDNFERFDAEGGDAGELGAAVCVYHRGEKVVDLWGGWRDAARTRPWTSDTLVLTFSATKGFSTMVMHSLAEEGKADLDAPIARLWPEFAANGKGGVTLRQVLTHTAGVPMVGDAEVGLGVSHEAWMRALEQAPLRHAPGQTLWYHAVTQGFILAEIVRRVTGRSFGAELRRRITDPLKADFYCGLVGDLHEQTAQWAPHPMTDLSALIRTLPPEDLVGRALRQLGPDLDFNSRAFRAAEVPASNGMGSAAGIARVYAALAEGGTLDGVRLFKSKTLEAARTLRVERLEHSTQRPWRCASGFLLSNPTYWCGPNPAAYGHQGSGGATGFADPENRIGFGYVLNSPKLPAADGTTAGRRLIDAVYRCLGL